MFETVRSTVNDISSEEIDRSCFGWQHFQCLTAGSSTMAPPLYAFGEAGVVTAGSSVVETPAGVNVGYTVDPDDTGTNPNSWANIADLELDGAGGAGYYLLPGKIIGAFNVRIKKWNPNSAGVIDGAYNSFSRWWAVVCATYTITPYGGATTEAVIRETIGAVRVDSLGVSVGASADHDYNTASTQEQNLSCWYMIDTKGVDVDPTTKRFTLNSLNIRAARAQCNGAALSDSSFTIATGSHTFFSVRG